MKRREFPMCGCRSCLGCDEFWCHRQGELQAELLDAPKHGSRKFADRLAPAERLLDALSPLAHRIARQARSSPATSVPRAASTTALWPKDACVRRWTALSIAFGRPVRIGFSFDQDTRNQCNNYAPLGRPDTSTEGWSASAVKRQSDGWPSAATKSRGIFILTPGPRDLAAV
jgi:hypothetical protein